MYAGLTEDEGLLKVVKSIHKLFRKHVFKVYERDQSFEYKHVTLIWAVKRQLLAVAPNDTIRRCQDVLGRTKLTRRVARNLRRF
jgi:hypothetical protein